MEFWPLRSPEDALAAFRQALARAEPSVSLSIVSVPPAAKWERVLYPLLGLNIPRLTRTIALSANGPRALTVFEDGDAEWLLVPTDKRSDRPVVLSTQRGETYQVDESECVPLQDGSGLVESFLNSGARPPDERWRRTRERRERG